MVSLIEIFITFLKIGLFTIGGGYAMLSLIQDEVCEKKQWVSNEEFLDIISIVNSLPGMFAANSVGFVGYKVRGTKGFVVAIAGCICPSIVIILILATIFTQVADNRFVQAFFMGVRPCIVVIMINAVIKFGSNISFRKAYNLIALIVAFTAIAFFKITSLYLVLAAVVVSLIIFAVKAKNKMIEGDKNDT